MQLDEHSLDKEPQQQQAFVVSLNKALSSTGVMTTPYAYIAKLRVEELVLDFHWRNV